MHIFRLPSKTILSATATVALLTLLGGMLASCERTVNPTSISVKDSIRHYYPIIQKDELRMTYELTNTGTETLVITDILPSCSAITLDGEMPDIIPAGKTAKLNFIYNSDINLGYVSHIIRLYGNMLPKGECALAFDVHVVRPTLEGSDYEEIFFAKQSAAKELVDGKLGEKGYWVGEGNSPEDYSRHYNQPLE